MAKSDSPLAYSITINLSFHAVRQLAFFLKLHDSSPHSALRFPNLLRSRLARAVTHAPLTAAFPTSGLSCDHVELYYGVSRNQFEVLNPYFDCNDLISNCLACIEAVEGASLSPPPPRPPPPSFVN